MPKPKTKATERPDLAISQQPEDSFLFKTERPNLDSRNRPISETQQFFYSEKTTDMENLDTYSRFKESFANQKAKAKVDAKPTLDSGTKRDLHRTLKGIHAATFPDHVTDLATAKSRHQAIVDLAGAGADEAEKDGPDPKKPRK